MSSEHITLATSWQVLGKIRVKHIHYWRRDEQDRNYKRTPENGAAT
jgi:hypothetical protein